MADKTPKPKTEKQVAQFAAQKSTAEKLKAAGLKAYAPNITYFQKEVAKGKSEAEVFEEIRKRQSAPRPRSATPKKTAAAAAPAAPAAPAAATKKNKNKNNNAKSTTSTRSAGVEARTLKLKEMAAKFKAQNIRYEGASMSYYTQEKKKGRSNDDILKNMKAMFPAYKETNTGEKVRVIAKRATSVKRERPAGNGAAAPAVAANAPVAVKGNAPKGSYICEKCRYVANNTTRKNNKKNNKPANVVNYTYNEQGY